MAAPSMTGAGAWSAKCRTAARSAPSKYESALSVGCWKPAGQAGGPRAGGARRAAPRSPVRTWISSRWTTGHSSPGTYSRGRSYRCGPRTQRSGQVSGRPTPPGPRRPACVPGRRQRPCRTTWEWLLRRGPGRPRAPRAPSGRVSRRRRTGPPGPGRSPLIRSPGPIPGRSQCERRVTSSARASRSSAADGSGMTSARWAMAVAIRSQDSPWAQLRPPARSTAVAAA